MNDDAIEEMKGQIDKEAQEAEPEEGEEQGDDYE